MHITNAELISEYYKLVRDGHPDLTLAQLSEAVAFPWRHLRGEMESGNLGSVRFRHLGLFRVYEGRARYMLGELGPRLERGLITRDKHDRARRALEGLLSRLAPEAPEATGDGGGVDGTE